MCTGWQDKVGQNSITGAYICTHGTTSSSAKFSAPLLEPKTQQRRVNVVNVFHSVAMARAFPTRPGAQVAFNGHQLQKWRASELRCNVCAAVQAARCSEAPCTFFLIDLMPGSCCKFDLPGIQSPCRRVCYKKALASARCAGRLGNSIKINQLTLDSASDRERVAVWT